jgi:MFS family permease
VDSAAPRRSRLLGPHLAGNRDFALLWSAASISMLGSAITQLALPTVAILQLHASVAVVGALTLVGWLPELLLSAVNGVVADRVRRRRMLVLCDVVNAVTVGSIPVAAAFGQLTLAHLFAAQAVRAAVGNLSDVTFFSFIPNLVRRETLVDANARLETSVQTSVLAGPGLAGLLIQWLGAARTMAFDAASFALSALLMRGIRNPGLPERGAEEGGASPASFLADLRAGLHFVFGDRVLRRLALASSLSNFGSAIGMAVGLVFAYREAHLTPGLLGLAITLACLPAPVAALNAPRLTRWLGPSRSLALAGALIGVTFLVMPLAGSFAAFPVFLAAYVLFNLPNAVWNVAMTTLRQHFTPAPLIGRMMATTMTVSRGSLPLGAAVGAALGSTAGLVPTLLVAGVVTMCSALPLIDRGLRVAEVAPSAA